MFLFEIILILLFATIGYLVLTTVFPPLNLPRSIPTVPFYVSLLPVFTSVDQEEIYNKYLREKLEKYGAVKLFFASRWNILVTRPEYLQTIFKNEELFAKSGNQKKTPYSVLADYTGDNVISSHGKEWKLYRSIMTQSIQFPQLEPVLKNTEKFIESIRKEVGKKGKALNVSDKIQRFCLENICECVLGIKPDAIASEAGELHERIKFVKKQIFNPVYLNFPILDRLPIPSRLDARKEVHAFRKYFCELVKRNKNEDSHTFAGHKLQMALETGKITAKQFTDNVIITMVAGHENPQLLLTSLLYVIAKYPVYQTKLREEVQSLGDKLQWSAFQDLPVLNSIMYETLRLYPPLGQIINRCTTSRTTMGDSINIPRGTYVGYNNFGTGRDILVWGPDANEFKPERWGITLEDIQNNFSQAKRTSRLPAFHGRSRACIGEKFALLETKVALAKIVDCFELSLDKSWKEQLTPAGPICPLLLSLKFKSLRE